MQELSKTFPDTVEIKNKGHLLEFCLDGTCDGFVSSGNFSVPRLKDFAYLYVYFFSDYTFLGEWRSKDDAKNTAERILSKPEYRSCKNENSRETARCVLRDLSKGEGSNSFSFVMTRENGTQSPKISLNGYQKSKTPL